MYGYRLSERVGQAFTCAAMLGAVACGSHISLGEDPHGSSGGSGIGGDLTYGGSAGNSSGGSYIDGDPNYGNGGNYAGSGGNSSGANGGQDIGGSTGSYGGATATPPGCLAQADADTWIAFDSDRDDFDRELYLVHPDGSGLTRVTERVGIDQEPAFSPDGEWLSFTSDRDGSLQIYLLELATGDVTQVTDRPDGADQSSFSHDGQLLAFHSGPSTYTIGIDGENEQLVASGPDSTNGYAHPHFTLDDAGVIVDRGNEIDVFSLDGSTQRQIVQNWTTTIRAPWPSPSGNDIVYQVSCDGAQTSLWTSPYSVKTDPCKGMRITQVGAPHSEHPSWGPSNRIAFARVSDATNAGQIAIVKRERGAAACLVTDGDADDRNPSWGPAAP